MCDSSLTLIHLLATFYILQCFQAHPVAECLKYMDRCVYTFLINLLVMKVVLEHKSAFFYHWLSLHTLCMMSRYAVLALLAEFHAVGTYQTYPFLHLLQSFMWFVVYADNIDADSAAPLKTTRFDLHLPFCDDIVFFISDWTLGACFSISC